MSATPENISTEPELVVLLDADGNAIGAADKSTVHTADTPYHLAFSCYAFRADGCLLVTRRSWRKKTWPGVWTNSCCGHPSPGEAVPDSVTRRLWQELGLRPRSLKIALPEFSYRAELDGVVENELCPVFLCRLDGDPRPNPDEVSEYSWMTWSDFLSSATADDSSISPWARLQAVALAPLVPAFLSATDRAQ